MQILDSHFAAACFPARNPFSHKGDYGHALLCAGSFGMMGAAVLAARACLRGGIGKLTVYVPGAGYSILQTAVPEAMVRTDPGERVLTAAPDLTPYDAIAVGPGLGTAPATAGFLQTLLEQARQTDKPVVIDADALNLLAAHPSMLDKLPSRTILTPHVGEFRRLAGGYARMTEPPQADFLPDCLSPAEMQALQMRLAKRWQAVVVLKGHETHIAADGTCYVNPTGNAGMATGGSGDVLTGLTLALLARTAMPQATGWHGDCSGTTLAACAACYVHGLAGDLAAKQYGETALIAGDIVAQIGTAVLEIATYK
ncbi:MAG: NAD(P)H-hydrate dehydratase [Bacteroidales bacterium]|nr:NAD(P)H-hydrate dehydratase [Bacteroidales bacterium]